MSILAATTVAALLIASPSSTDADRVAANAGFLLGNAQRCGIDDERVVRAAGLVRGLIEAASADANDKEAATNRFAEFFLVSAFADPRKQKLVASCRVVSRELGRLEGHQFQLAGAGE